MKKSNKLLALITSLVMALTVFVPVTANAGTQASEELDAVIISDLDAPPAGALGSPIVGYKIEFRDSSNKVVKPAYEVVDSYWGRGLGTGLIKDNRTVIGRTYFAKFAVKILDSKYKIGSSTYFVVNEDWGNYGDFWDFTRDVQANMVSCMTNEKFTVTKGTYDGTGTFKQSKKFKSVGLSPKSFAYSGKARIPKVTVKNGGAALVDGKDYTVQIKDASNKVTKSPKNVGKYTVVVAGYGDYIDYQSTATYTINPKSTSLKSLKAGKKSFTATWSKQATQTTGYQLRYGTSSKFSDAKTVTITKNKTIKKTVKKLKAKKKYYVQVRTYKSVSGKKYYSSWSKTKTVKTK